MRGAGWRLEVRQDGGHRPRQKAVSSNRAAPRPGVLLQLRRIPSSLRPILSEHPSGEPAWTRAPYAQHPAWPLEASGFRVAVAAVSEAVAALSLGLPVKQFATEPPRIGRPMALGQASAERGGSREATAGTDRAGCGPICGCRSRAARRVTPERRRGRHGPRLGAQPPRAFPRVRDRRRLRAGCCRSGLGRTADVPAGPTARTSPRASWTPCRS